MVTNLIHNRVVVFHPGAYSKDPLGSVPTVLSCYIVNPFTSVPRLVTIFRPFRPLLHIHYPWRRLHSLKVQSSLLPLSIGHLLSRSLLLPQKNIEHWMSRNILGYSVLVTEGVHLRLL